MFVSLRRFPHAPLQSSSASTLLSDSQKLCCPASFWTDIAQTGTGFIDDPYPDISRAWLHQRAFPSTWKPLLESRCIGRSCFAKNYNMVCLRWGKQILYSLLVLLQYWLENILAPRTFLLLHFTQRRVVMSCPRVGRGQTAKCGLKMVQIFQLQDVIPRRFDLFSFLRTAN